jgi:BON domain
LATPQGSFHSRKRMRDFTPDKDGDRAAVWQDISPSQIAPPGYSPQRHKGHKENTKKKESFGKSPPMKSRVRLTHPREAKMRRWHWATLALLVCGCGGQDVDRLGRICTKTAGKFQDMAGGPQGKMANGWQAMCGALSDTTLDARVAVRIHWDKELADADIQVQPAGPGVVRLHGTVADAAQHQRAKNLAESTQGVEQVVNDLVIVEQ